MNDELNQSKPEALAETREPHRLPVFYRPELSPALGRWVPALAKPAAVVAHWQLQHLPIELRNFAPATRADLAGVHSDRYVDGVLAGRLENGFGDRDPQVAKQALWAVGGMLAAVDYVLATGGIACVPVSGFSLARYEFGASNCTFNGLAAAAFHAHLKQRSARIGILDFNLLPARGTAQIARTRKFQWLVHHSEGAFGHGESGQRFRTHSKSFLLACLPSEVLPQFEDCALLIVQCSVDCVEGDSQGGWMREIHFHYRDAAVFRWARKRGIPVVWCLGGGSAHTPDEMIRLADLHACTLRAAATVDSGAYDKQDSSPEPDFED